MEIDQPEGEIARKSGALRNLASNGPLPISVAKLSGSSRIIPSEKDFHFYNNFEEFKRPIAEIDGKARALLGDIGAAEDLIGKAVPLPDDKAVELDEDVAIDWLVSINDHLHELIDLSLDEFKRLRKKEEESGARTMRVDGDDEDGFQMVSGKKNKKSLGRAETNGEGAVKVAEKLKPKVPFHVPSIPKSQDVFKIIVNNSNQPFDHVWLEKTEDGSAYIHPLEKLSVLDFVDTSTSEPIEPLPIEVTPFTLVEDVKDLKLLAQKLRSVNEFAVDLEHNQFRSFQGLTCLMQISTRSEDFIIDTLKLRIHIGPHLRELFKDPTKRKVLHGANSDVHWLQRDFGIYICNMFDTGQASRVLKMERYSLEHLLDHFCEVKANKEYQNADWRIRPLPNEMIKYAREDTHYLLYIYDRMRIRLLALPAESETSDPPLIEVYKRSYGICTQLYEKELLTDNSYLHLYGLQEADLNAQQLAIVSGLYEWRDIVARAEDESTGYVLPNKALIDIAKQVPLTVNHLRRAVKSKHPYIERNANAVVSIIRHSIQKADAFKEACEFLKQRRAELREARTLAQEEPEVLPSDVADIVDEEPENIESSGLPCDPVVEDSLSSIQHRDEDHNKLENSHLSPRNKVNGKSNVDDGSAHHGEHGDSKYAAVLSNSAEATVETLKKPSRAFGALFGNSAKRKFSPDKREKEDSKLEQIKSTVSLPFHTFSGGDERSHSEIGKPAKISEAVHQEDSSPPATGSALVDIIVLDDDSDMEEKAAADNNSRQVENNGAGSAEEDEPMSVNVLSSSFQKCFPSLDQAANSQAVDKSQQSENSVEVKPFDYEAARKQVKFGEDKKSKATEEGGESGKKRERKKGSTGIGKDDEIAEHPQGRRRQAFPASGNRSATFR